MTLPANLPVLSRVTIQNPRPRKFASAAERQKAFRERFPTLTVRVEEAQAEAIRRIADEQGRTQQEVLLSMLKFALTNRNWLQLGLTQHKQLPRFEDVKDNPMARTPTPAQLAARERFAEMARSGAFKRKAKRNPAKKTVSQKISELTREGYPQKQAVAIALSEKREGKVKANPAPRGFVKADDDTIEVFNKYGMKPYDAVYMQTKGGRGEPTYDLTILKHENGKYLAAHGSVIVKEEFDRASDAAAYLEEWYLNNRRPAARRNNPRKPTYRRTPYVAPDPDLAFTRAYDLLNNLDFEDVYYRERRISAAKGVRLNAALDRILDAMERLAKNMKP